jgi:hypothetical protein
LQIVRNLDHTLHPTAFFQSSIIPLFRDSVQKKDSPQSHRGHGEMRGNELSLTELTEATENGLFAPSRKPGSTKRFRGEEERDPETRLYPRSLTLAVPQEPFPLSMGHRQRKQSFSVASVSSVRDNLTRCFSPRPPRAPATFGSEKLGETGRRQEMKSLSHGAHRVTEDTEK